MTARFRVGVDIGGTFTDIVLLDAGGRIHTKKVSSSVDDYARAIVDGLGELFGETGLGGGDRSEERRVGKECPSLCRSRGPPDHLKKKNKYHPPNSPYHPTQHHQLPTTH